MRPFRSSLLLLLLATPPLRADLEPWSDPALPVSDGLVLWLDATRQDRAYEAGGLTPVAPGGPLFALFDGSGRGRHFVQHNRDAWPRLLASGGRAAIRFDGRDDYLQHGRPGLKFERLTAFLVASPRSNVGFFRGLLASSAIGRRDYESGFTLDLGGPPTARFEAFNAEGRGFGGARDLMDESFPFGTFHTIEARVGDGPGGVALSIDGRPQGRRDRQPGPLAADELILGARIYSNEAVPDHVQGFLDGDVAEVLLFDRILSDDESLAVRAYLDAKHAGLADALGPLAGAGGKPWPVVADPPPVQVLAPGFEVRKLPVDLKNVNNVRYRDDGVLVALGYNGDILLLTDRDGDGLEEHVATFWESDGRLRGPIGLALTRPGDPRGRGVYVPSKGKVSLILDRDGDDRADEEVVVASGWQELPVAVDALGVALADDGSLYFGLGTADFTNAYLLDPSGRAHYDPKAERGAIVRVAPDTGARERVASGIRFPVGLAFNRRGDLFATDQEGATWLPNGNPFDELLHIRAGRHYGFPPRHPKHLPGVIDEPSTFDYRPQHQSTCGLQFNEPTRVGGPTFGPPHWAGDALVSGYSRGKLYRTELVATRAGYVARTSLVAALQALTVDACVAPDGSLVVSTHSGGPDWGSGPEGQGALYRLTYTDRDVPQPIAAWAESPREVRVGFDRPLDPEHLRTLGEGVAIEYGPAVSAGDRYETLRPGYAVVGAQVAAPRLDLRVHSVGVTPDRRTLILATDPQSDAASTYAVTLPGLGRPARRTGPRGELPQDPAIDLAYDLHGVRAEWRAADGDASWSGWLPHLDLAASRAFTEGLADQEPLWPRLADAGTLTLRTRLDLANPLRPAVQPGSRLDATLPPERVALTLAASGPFEARLPGGRVERSAPVSEGHAARLDLGTPEGPIELEVALTTSEGSEPRLDVAFVTDEDDRPRPLPLIRLILPWARHDASPEPPTAPTLPPELAGGSWARGRAEFFGKEARCAECHGVRGEGGKIGPDLSNLPHRDYASVLRDVREPSFAVNPDYLTYNVALDDGRVLSGTVRSEGDRLLVGDAEGREVVVARAEVESMQPSSVSTMPEGLPDALGPERLRDLLTFLLTPDLEPAPLTRGDAPPPRTRAEVEAALGPATPDDRPRQPLKVVLVGGPKDHGPDEHDYPLWRSRWADLLGRAEGVTVETADAWPSDEQLGSADVLAFYSANPAWSVERGVELDAFLARGGGLVLIHYAVNGRGDPEGLARRIGLAWRDGRSRFRHGPLELTFTDPAHPLTRGLQGLRLVDESYWELAGDPSAVEVLATAVEDGAPRPLIWTRRVGRGRVFVSIPGHYTWTFDDPLFRVLLLRGLAWSAGEPADRFRDLATPGARLAEEVSGDRGGLAPRVIGD